MAKNGNKIRTIFYVIVASITILGTAFGSVYGIAEYVGRVNDNCEKVGSHEFKIAEHDKFITKMQTDIDYLKKDAEAQTKDRNEMMEMQRAILHKLGA